MASLQFAIAAVGVNALTEYRLIAEARAKAAEEERKAAEVHRDEAATHEKEATERAHALGRQMNRVYAGDHDRHGIRWRCSDRERLLPVEADGADRSRGPLLRAAVVVPASAGRATEVGPWQARQDDLLLEGQQG